MFPKTLDLNFIICQSLLAEFLPATERMNPISLLEEHDYHEETRKRKDPLYEF